jgi:pyrroloquinoline quinone (PQQ) biosynthesis protein C
VSAWTAGEELLERLAVLYAIEASQPEVARTKLDGLTAHYGYSSEGPAVEYFTTHERRDVEHARQGGALIEELIAAERAPRERADNMVRRAEQALRGNQVLLDGVEACARR